MFFLLVAVNFLMAFTSASAKPTGKAPSILHDRETACITLSDCGGKEDPDPSIITGTLQPHAPTPSTSQMPASTTSSSGTPSPVASLAAQANPIKKGFTAFGDSFAAGIGTGTTEGSGYVARVSRCGLKQMLFEVNLMPLTPVAALRSPFTPIGS